MEPVTISPWNSMWKQQFYMRAQVIREHLGSTALRIDHIGSTSVPELKAKPIIDIQVSVASLTPENAYRDILEQLSYAYQPENPDRTKRFFMRHDEPRVNLHVRVLGSWHQQFPLLFRDYLRTHPAACRMYAAEKVTLARKYRHDRGAYCEAKDPIFWKIQYQADRWACQTGWEAGPSDA